MYSIYYNSGSAVNLLEALKISPCAAGLVLGQTLAMCKAGQAKSGAARGYFLAIAPLRQTARQSLCERSTSVSLLPAAVVVFTVFHQAYRGWWLHGYLGRGWGASMGQR